MVAPYTSCRVGSLYWQQEQSGKTEGDESMNYTPPFLPEERTGDESLSDRVARARKLREDAAARVKERYADSKPSEGKWRSGDSYDLEMERLSVI